MDYFFKHISEEFVRPFHNSVLIFATILFIILLAPLLLRKLRVSNRAEAAAVAGHSGILG